MPEQCEKCENKSFRQVGDDYVCKKCGHVHKGKPENPKQNKPEKS